MLFIMILEENIMKKSDKNTIFEIVFYYCQFIMLLMDIKN